MSECVVCESEKNVIVHHVQYEPEETVKLCRSCHRVAHENSDHKYHPKDELPEGFTRESSDITTIEVSHDTWTALNKRKNLGETFDDVVQRLLDKQEATA